MSSPPPPPAQNGTENSSPDGGGDGIGTGGVVAISVVAGFLLLGFIGVLIWCMRRKIRKVLVSGDYVMPSTLASSPESGKHTFLFLS